MNLKFKIAVLLFVITFISGITYAGEKASGSSPAPWTGGEIGIFAGQWSGEIDYNEPEDPDYQRSPDVDGFLAGVILGYNKQIDSIVLGIDADIGSGNLDEGVSHTGFNNYSAFDVKWNGHLRGKAGYVINSALFYVAAGLAIANVEVDDTDSGWEKNTKKHIGWTLGCGIAYRLNTNLTVRLEYLYDDYGKETYTMTGPFDYEADVDLTAQTARIALSYSF